ncbi:dromaiocalcin-1-like [Pempheris klunzingeri]|uniref:dromaiocalcin-1-like n=1 Tax=Pempheris klunzingeri TaxID=3127111 RepID=UPI00397F1B79
MTFLPFYCFNSSVVEVKKTWEKALKHCRKTHAKLISLLSETEHWLAQKAIQRVQITERVWFGLRYLSDRWLWVDKHPLVYQAWPRGGDQDHQCPAWKRCGALTKGGLWENRDCQERLHFICM